MHCDWMEAGLIAGLFTDFAQGGLVPRLATVAPALERCHSFFAR